MWSYLTDTLIPAVITTDPPLAVDRANIILGKVRLRQQRVKQGLYIFVNACKKENLHLASVYTSTLCMAAFQVHFHNL